MPITFVSDTLKDISVKEERGKIISLTRTGIAEGISSTDFSGVLQVLASTSLSSYNTYPSTYTNLRLVNRTVEIIPEDNTRAHVTLEYASYGDDGMNFTWRISSSLTQRETEKDIYGNQLYVQHTWSSDDADYPSETHTQGSRVPVMLPATTLIAQGILKSDYAAILSNQWTGAINLDYWFGGLPYTWMCTRADGTPHDITKSPKWWDFTFEFQYDQLGWKPEYWFEDPRTSKPAPNLVANTGVKVAEVYKTRYFGTFFGAG